MILIDSNIIISIITYSEVLSAKLTDDMFDEVCRVLQDNFKILMLDVEIAKLSAKNRQLKKIKLPDAMIGATAMVNNIPLVTRNVKDFAHLPIQIINPMDNLDD